MIREITSQSLISELVLNLRNKGKVTAFVESGDYFRLMPQFYVTEERFQSRKDYACPWDLHFLHDKKKLEEWLCYTSTRCDSLKSHMEYMKMLWHDIQPDIPEVKKSFDSLNCHDCQMTVLDNGEVGISKPMDYDNFLENFSDNQVAFIDDNDDAEKCNSCEPSPVLKNILPKINVHHKGEKVENSSTQKETTSEVTALTPRTYSLPQSTHTVSRSLSPLHKIKEVSSARDEIKLNNFCNGKAGSLGRNKVAKKKEKVGSSTLSSKKDSLCKLDEMVSLKLKKRRRKLHCSISKSTVATRDTNFLGRKDTKKRKQKNNAANRHILKPIQTSNEVVEIYHNKAAKSGSTPVITGKHSKIDRLTNCVNRLSSAANKQHTVPAKTKCENGNYQRNVNVSEDNGQDSSQGQYQFKPKAEGQSTNACDEDCNLEVATNPAYALEKCKSPECEHSVTQALYCNPMNTRNYEMPTLASKLKRVNRSYFSRFNFRNIPFVVGTSITPSHNLGLNIQQVLSIMKTRQPTVNGVTPLLIRKVSRGIKPVSILMKQITDQCSKLSHMSSQMMATSVQKEFSFMNDPEYLCENGSGSLQYEKKGLSTFNLKLTPSLKQCQNLQETIKDNEDKNENFHEKKNIRSENRLNKCNTAQISGSTGNATLFKLFSSQQNVKTQMEVPEMRAKSEQDNVHNMEVHSTQSINQSQSANGIREVLVNLHDQFEEMNTKYEKLQAKAEKSNTKDLEEEIQNLEKDLNTKEDEINAVVNLYKEVMSLKQQMRVLQERNSFVCISSEVPLGPNKIYSSMPFTLSKSYGSNLQKSNNRVGSTIIPTKQPTSIRLAGLLRQIQTFQKQLSS
ncbi:uncharacterized protein LOC143377532 isoform X2 [Andrena cerasifolii]|uniref:uncharacterized protein LOC143377532 isoform X2 n=1 Tax=Andrena cerasifolii TaxID=2819439 RepID=UPI004037D551